MAIILRKKLLNDEGGLPPDGGCHGDSKECPRSFVAKHVAVYFYSATQTRLVKQTGSSDRLVLSQITSSF